ncbi:MAG TPA: dihydrolipoamide acetyltransferase family protein [Gammaproteobacteria bacterium]|nr:dihydrolipoamide acetyltransferase family protein [Gammaproteobacteria bacterium]
MKIFYLPDLGEGLAEAEIREWYVKPGDDVVVDQPLVSMETAKAVVDVPSPYTGKIAVCHGKANDVLKTGSPLVSYETEGATADQGSVVGNLPHSTSAWDDGDVIIGAATAAKTSVKAMPAARFFATENNIDLHKVKGSGPQGLITLDDVKRHQRQENAVVFTGETESLHGVRRMMAQAMSQSHQHIVPVTIVEDADISHLPEKTDITVLLMQAIIAAAKAEPALNAWFDGQALVRQLVNDVNIGMAVDSAEGLFVPVIHAAQQKSPSELREKINEYKVSVANRSIAASDMQGLTITLSNFGTIAGRYATPIIVPPSVAILGCGRSREAVVVKQGEMKAGRIMPLSLTFDHRAATGGEATRFLGAVIAHLQSAKV